MWQNNLQVLKKIKGPTFNLKVETVAGSLVACFCPDAIVPTVLCFSPDQGQHTLVTEQTKQQLYCSTFKRDIDVIHFYRSKHKYNMWYVKNSEYVKAEVFSVTWSHRFLGWWWSLQQHLPGPIRPLTMWLWGRGKTVCPPWIPAPRPA